MKKIKFRWNSKSIISIIAVIGLMLGIIAVASSAFGGDRDTISSYSFKVGGLNDQGSYKETDKSIYTEEAFDCIGLRVEPDFEFVGTYDVYYYDFDENLIEAIKGLKGIYDEDYPQAKLCRIVVHPEIPEDEDVDDFKISWYEVFSLARKFDVTVDAKQKYPYKTINLYDDTKALRDTSFAEEEDGALFHPGDVYTPLKDMAGVKVSEEISLVEGCKNYDIYVKYDVIERDFYHFYVIATSGDKVVAYAINKNTDYKPGEWIKLTLTVPEDENADHLRVRLGNDADCFIFGY